MKSDPAVAVISFCVGDGAPRVLFFDAPGFDFLASKNFGLVSERQCVLFCCFG
jgi:hypothetical protein